MKRPVALGYTEQVLADEVNGGDAVWFRWDGQEYRGRVHSVARTLGRSEVVYFVGSVWTAELPIGHDVWRRP